ncbi:MAG: DUF4157 domain-containing protein [Chitinispirillales bacterium]|jgi:hypothetical protein|nr:DUF4157 domain-containing protein [Chitinispirillales bacterium]
MFEVANRKSQATMTATSTKPQGLSFDDVRIRYNTDTAAQMMAVQRVEFDEEEELLQGKFNDTVQREALDWLEEEDELLQGKFSNTAQMTQEETPSANTNRTGIPDAMKTQFENVSGFSFDDVRIHYNSDKPARLDALAYTQGNQVHIAPGQEKHLGHELGHVVQQKEGRVKPTMQLQGVNVNDDASLEREADVMGLFNS